MTSRVLFAGVFITLGIYLLLILQQHVTYAAEASSSGYPAAVHKPTRNRVLTRFARPMYTKLKPEMFNDFFVDDDEFFELLKRQTSDDYGHMRFGKRGDEQFDDYGHMRFGRSGSDKE